MTNKNLAFENYLDIEVQQIFEIDKNGCNKN